MKIKKIILSLVVVMFMVSSDLLFANNIDNKFKGVRCPDNLILTQNLKAPDQYEKYVRNGQYNGYTKGIVREAHILQQHLNRLGFNAGKVDGIIGPNTRGAILRLQKYLGTTPDGYVGPETRKLLNNSCTKENQDETLAEESQQEKIDYLIAHLKQAKTKEEQTMYLQALIKTLSDKKEKKNDVKEIVEKKGYEYTYYPNGKIREEVKMHDGCPISGKGYSLEGEVLATLTSQKKNGWYFSKVYHSKLTDEEKEYAKYFIFGTKEINKKIGSPKNMIEEYKCQSQIIIPIKFKINDDNGFERIIIFDEDGEPSKYTVFDARGKIIYENDLQEYGQEVVDNAKDAKIKSVLASLRTIAALYWSEHDTFVGVINSSKFKNFVDSIKKESKKIKVGAQGEQWGAEALLSTGKYYCVDSSGFEGETDESSIEDGENSKDVDCGEQEKQKCYNIGVENGKYTCEEFPQSFCNGNYQYTKESCEREAEEENNKKNDILSVETLPVEYRDEHVVAMSIFINNLENFKGPVKIFYDYGVGKIEQATNHLNSIYPHNINHNSNKRTIGVSDLERGVEYAFRGRIEYEIDGKKYTKVGKTIYFKTDDFINNEVVVRLRKSNSDYIYENVKHQTIGYISVDNRHSDYDFKLNNFYVSYFDEGVDNCGIYQNNKLISNLKKATFRTKFEINNFILAGNSMVDLELRCDVGRTHQSRLDFIDVYFDGKHTGTNYSRDFVMERGYGASQITVR